MTNQTNLTEFIDRELRAELAGTLEVALDAYDRGRVDRANFALMSVMAEALIEIACSLKAIELKMTI